MDKTAAQQLLEEAQADLDAYRVDQAAMQERWTHVREAHEAAIDLRLEELTDAEIMGDEATLRWMLKASWSHRGASERKHRLAKPGVPELADEYTDGRAEWEQDVLPALQLRLKRDQDITHVAEALRVWARIWALGRPDLHISILERTLSERASYGLTYYVATDTACTDNMRRYVHEQGAEMPLEDVLKLVAKNCWYESDNPADLEDDYS